MTATLARTHSVPEIAARWGCKPSKVIALIRSGQLVGIRIGGGDAKPRYRVRPEDLARFEQSREVQPPARRGRKPKPQRPAGFIEYFAE
ncbi:MAG: helix-turn-helix domain-containing protein [Planctomycetota bacterium]